MTASFISLTASGHYHNHAPNACDHELHPNPPPYRNNPGTYNIIIRPSCDDELTQILHYTRTIQEHIYHTAQQLISIVNQRDFFHTNVESVQSISTCTLLLLSHNVYGCCKLLFISFALSASKTVSAANSRLDISMSPHKY